jgi:hypothetical protein
MLELLRAYWTMHPDLRLEQVVGRFLTDYHVNDDAQIEASLREELGAGLPVPHVKVTEVVGNLHDEPYFCNLREDGGIVSLHDCLPKEACGNYRAPGPRGRFRITVEFWPDHPKP